MLIRIEDIKDEGLSLDFEETQDAFPTLAAMAEGGECEFLTPLKVHLRAVRVGELVDVEGKVEAMMGLSCSRCLRDFSSPLATDFSLAYTRELPEVSDESDEEGVELSAEDMGLILFHGDEIDLRDGIQEQVVMAMPLRPLCSEECLGLCPECGADLNSNQCDCERPDFNIKFAALRNLRIHKEDKK